MKKVTKMLLVAGGAALICGGAVMTYLKAQTPMTPQDELTLANIEALGVEKEMPAVKVPCCPAYWYNVCIFEMIMGDGSVANGEMGGAINC